MTMFKSMAFAGTVAVMGSLSFAWTISGTVQTNQGSPLAGVKVSSFNYAGYETTSGDDGAFSLSNEGGVGLHSVTAAKASIGFNHNVITISNSKADSMTGCGMDGLGRVGTCERQHNDCGIRRRG